LTIAGRIVPAGAAFSERMRPIDKIATINFTAPKSKNALIKPIEITRDCMRAAL
jgi:hypothetical protein